MSIAFSGIELVNIAIGIERRGIAFYDVMARSTENATARDIFRHLADMERDHIKIFQGTLSEADEYQAPQTYSDEYSANLRALTDSAVFPDEFATSKMTAEADSDIRAIELAISAEKDSILFYYEMKDIVPKRTQLIVNKIISEEKSHLRQLSELKKQLAS